MLIHCPYPDCFADYELALPAVKPISLSPVRCPSCKKEGTAIPLEIRNKMLEKARLQEGSIQSSEQFCVLLENIRSLWNVGSIFRTCDAAGISKLYLCGITGCPPRAEITKTALGAEQIIPWQYFAHPLDIIPQLKAKGICILGLERNQSSIDLSGFLREKKLSKPICLLIGNENRGLSPETIHYCDYICSLPMQGQKESLNAAVAFGIAAYLINEFLT